MLDAGGSVTGTQALSSVVQPLGPTLGKFFEDYTTARLTGNFTSVVLAGVLPQTQGSIVVGSSTGAHLAGDPRRQPPRRSLRRPRARPGHRHRPLLLGLARPQGRASGRRRVNAVLLRECEGLRPAGLHSLGQHRDADGIPWNTCGGSPRAYVSLPNESNDVAPPSPSTVASSPSRARSRSTSPSRPRQPKRLRVSRSSARSSRRRRAIRRPSSHCTRPSSSVSPRRRRLLRFIVFSSGDGTLKATLGSTWLGSAGLHAGNNDVRYVLPTQSLKSLRKTNTPPTSSCSRATHRAARKAQASPAASRCSPYRSRRSPKSAAGSQ